MDANDFLNLAAPILNRAPGQVSSLATAIRFKRFFGISHEVCAHVWLHLLAHELLSPSHKPVHMLWACMFLRNYDTFLVMSIFLRKDEKTVRKYVWPMVDAIGALATELVSFGQLAVIPSVRATHFSVSFLHFLSTDKIR